LTRRKIKSKQIEALHRMGLPFWVNAANASVVARAAIEGRREKIEPELPVRIVPEG